MNTNKMQLAANVTETSHTCFSLQNFFFHVIFLPFGLYFQIVKILKVLSSKNFCYLALFISIIPRSRHELLELPWPSGILGCLRLIWPINKLSDWKIHQGKLNVYLTLIRLTSRCLARTGGWLQKPPLSILAQEPILAQNSCFSNGCHQF